MNLPIFSVCLFGLFGCSDDLYYDAEFDPKFGRVQVSKLGTSDFGISPAAAGVAAKEFDGKFADLEILVDFSNEFRSHIEVELTEFSIADQKGNLRDLLPDATTDGPNRGFTNQGDPIGGQFFSSEILPDLKEGEYTIEIAGELCEASNCFDFEHSVEVKLVFKKLRYWHT